jgi:hypothetical protein
MAVMPVCLPCLLLVLRLVVLVVSAAGSPNKVRKGFAMMIVVTHVSGNANNGSDASVFTLNGNNDSTNRNRNIGSQLAVVVSAYCRSLLQGWGEHVEPIQFGSVSEQLGY